jgi:hypothetical protein
VFLFCLIDNLLFVINSIKQDIVNRVQNPREEREPSMGQKLEILIKDTLGKESTVRDRQQLMMYSARVKEELLPSPCLPHLPPPLGRDLSSSAFSQGSNKLAYLTSHP